MSASKLDADYPWLQEHLRGLTFENETERKVQADMEQAGLVYPHDIESPGGCWVELVMASKVQDHNARKQHVLKWMALARGSQWTREMFLALQEQEDDDSEPEVEYGGPFQDNLHPHTVKDLLDAADAISTKEEDHGTPVDLDMDSEPMTEPFGEE